MSDNRDTKSTNEWIIANFGKINTKEIDPIAVSNKRKKLLFEKGFDIIVDEINDIIFNSLNKGIYWKLLNKQIIEHSNYYNINPQEIYDWLSNNPNDSNSIFLFGYFNYHGIGVSEDVERAYNLFIDVSHVSGKIHTLAQCFIGECYEYGYGIIKDEELAFEYYEKVANKNFAYGQLRIGYCYYNEIGIEKDLKMAYYWYEKAAKNGNLLAMQNLGLFYQDGIGVEKDYNKAFELFEQSSKGGCLEGICSLGYFYEHGIGTKIDKKKALELYQKAANLGNEVA
ncbi:hypothetical protein RclHR1_10580003 [Rhizophagus clarus]|uniref:Kinase-like domain-containing protein n=1 Tax=Rhizophagus clarus TaxID=94130 RepID=A0A2Z6Q331_9GLOM|nr:hypothetical protein RclHR1_10580003 [Rhizophagus clarus]GET04703.1 kinase-like domain-containing protein [Rhizophagus clarus]